MNLEACVHEVSATTWPSEENNMGTTTSERREFCQEFYLGQGILI